MSDFAVDRYSAAAARKALAEAKEILKPLAIELLSSRTMTRDQREDIGRKINSGIVKVTTAELKLEVKQ